MFEEGNSDRSRYTPEQKEEIKERLLELYASRESLSSIRFKTGLPSDTVKQWLNEAIQELKEPDPAKERQKDLILVDTSIRALIPAVLEGKPSAHQALNRWLERRAKYLGLDEPEKLDLGGNFHGSIEDEVKDLLERLGIRMDIESPDQ